MNDYYELSYIVVDDDEDDRFLMKSALEKANRPLPVFEFADGQELIDYLNENTSIRSDQDMHWLIIMDINMPRLNGLDALKIIRQDSYWAKLPILILSTSDDPALVEKALANGANGYITKPTLPDKFVDIFDKFFSPWLKVNSNQWL